MKNIKYDDPVVFPLKPGPTAYLNTASNPHNDTTSSVAYGLVALSTSSYADEIYASEQLSDSSDY